MLVIRVEATVLSTLGLASIDHTFNTLQGQEQTHFMCEYIYTWSGCCRYAHGQNDLIVVLTHVVRTKRTSAESDGEVAAAPAPLVPGWEGPHGPDD